MALKRYSEKRAFDETPEPPGRLLPSKKEEPLHFCIQKHAASHLHYDLRLEHKGVLLSWAVPKEPTNDPNVKRLAIMVEDHPLEYRHFEGVIPKGNYGAGIVKIWDEGTFIWPDAPTRKETEKKITEGLLKGHIDFQLAGNRLKGSFSLIKLKNAENNWLLIKRKETTQAKELKEMPSDIKPMLAKLGEEPFDNEEWLFETKWDGYRAIAYKNGEKISLVSRNQLSYNKLFDQIVEDLKNIPDDVILDGEVVILDSKGISRFQLLQNYQNTHKGTLYYFVFDILYHNGHDLRNMPLVQRKEALKKILASSNCSQVRYSDHIENRGIVFFREAQKLQLEGIMGKKKDSTYSTVRSSNWIKIKTKQSQEAVIGGFTKPKGSRKHFGALLLGVYEGDRFVYVGHVGGGFNQKLLQDLFAKIAPLEQENCPFEKKPKTNTPATWIKPKLICEVVFSEWTSDGSMRHPVFKGLRMDKKPTEVKKENPIEPEKKSKRKTKVVNLEKVYWPDEGYTKDDLMRYYAEIAPIIMPYLENRPLMLRRFPEGINGQTFYQKDVSSLHLPEYVQTKRIVHEKKPITYMIVNNPEALEYAVNLGAIELHPFLSTKDSLDNPVYMVIDLDPEDISFEEVIDVAQVIHQLLDSIKVKSYCKTSGGRGLHVCIPLESKYTFEQAKRFGEVIAALVHQQIPGITSLKRSPKDRQQRVYIDVYQNNRGQTLVPPYIVRAKPGATVSTPLKWAEVKSGLTPQSFTIKTVPARVKKLGDIFKPVLGKGVNLASAIKLIEKL